MADGESCCLEAADCDGDSLRSTGSLAGEGSGGRFAPPAAPTSACATAASPDDVEDVSVATVAAGRCQYKLPTIMPMMITVMKKYFLIDVDFVDYSLCLRPSFARGCERAQ